MCARTGNTARGIFPAPSHVPLADIGDKVKKLKKDKDLVVYCRQRQPEHLGHQAADGHGLHQSVQSEGRLQCLEKTSSAELKRDYRRKRPAIEKRLAEFRKIIDKGDTVIFEELCYCILTAGSSAKMGMRTRGRPQ